MPTGPSLAGAARFSFDVGPDADDTRRAPCRPNSPRSKKMRVLRHAVVDLVALAFALFAVSFRAQAPWAKTVLLGYTALMLVLKLGALVAKVRPPRPADAPPDALYHVVFGAMVVACAVAQWWGLAAAWVVIWALSFFAGRRAPAPAPKAAAKPAARPAVPRAAGRPTPTRSGR